MRLNIRKRIARLMRRSSIVRPGPWPPPPDIHHKRSQRKTRDMGIYVARLQVEMDRHIGRQRAIGMGELYELVFLKRWNNRINDTRDLRTVITELREQGAAICSYCSGDGKGGYYKPSAGSELEDYCRRLRKSALKKLILEAKIRRISKPEMLGQLELEFPGDFDEAA